MFFQQWKKDYKNNIIVNLKDPTKDLESFFNVLLLGPQKKNTNKSKEKILKEVFLDAENCKSMYEKIKTAREKIDIIDKYVTILMNSVSLPIHVKLKLQTLSDDFTQKHNAILDKLQMLLKYLPLT